MLLRILQGQVIDPLELSIARSMNEYHSARTIHPPDALPASAGGQVKTSKSPLPSPPFQSTRENRIANPSFSDWELEIRKRYLHPLSSETFEFPSPSDLHARMIPICYEESLPNGCNADCAEFMATALDHYMKAVISNIVGRVRSDLPGLNSVAGGVITTSAHANAASRGVKQKKESAEARKALGVGDMRVAVSVGGWGELAQMPTVVMGFMNGWNEGVLEGWVYGDGGDEEEEEREDEMQRGGKRPAVRPMVDGLTNGVDGYFDEGEDEDQNWGWAGGAMADRRQLGSLLDECLAIGS